MSPTESRTGQEPAAAAVSPSPIVSASPAEPMDVDEAKSAQDVAKFGGKIVYNPDGSAYIIDGSDASDEDSLLPMVPKVEGSIVVDDERTGSPPALPPIANAFYISRGYAGALANYAKMFQPSAAPSDTPVVHSYRVYSVRDRREAHKRKEESSTNPLAELATVPVKPILMCFICKLSFGCVRTFVSHCDDTHGLRLTEEEMSILNSNNSSAIIQSVGKDRETTVSFLEPFLSSTEGARSRQSPPPVLPPPPAMSPGAIKSLLSAAAAAASLPKVPTTVQPPASSPSQSSNPAASPITADDGQPLRHSPMSSSATPPPRQSPSSRSPATSPPSAGLIGSPSPITLPPPSSYGQLPTNANMLQGTTIGACPEHINGRPTGEECKKCDLILSQSRMGGLGWNVSRNSCKTLKCPKCNWHYKYQETLEIHMKEKHPETETTCIYCITGQQHPRLARGETYTCGYKPYRCEVCNYSTTTKGNLSIHMQSDKHLNNMQELQNGGLLPSSTTSGPQNLPKMPSVARSLPSSLPAQPMPSPSKPKPTWRCDVCNYETNVARNLRIHMTSEKHTHNVMAIQQQSASTMQKLMAAASSSSPGAAGGFPRLPLPPSLEPKQLLGGLFGGGVTGAPGSEQAAMADLAYNQALLAQLMSGGQLPSGPPPPLPPTSTAPADFASLFAGAAAAAAASAGENGNTADPPPETVDPNPKHLFSCNVCNNFGCDTIEELNEHLSKDRSRTGENEVSIVIAGNYWCHLCNYKTNLKANFQLHCKTDKHLQRLSHVNHIKEGGPANEWKLRFLASMNPVEIRCNATDFVTNSPHKMQVHINSQQYQVSALLFNHLKREEERIGNSSNKKLSYTCTLCQFSAPGKHALMVHVRSMKHLQMEQMHQLKKRAEGNTAQTEIGDIFQVVEDDVAPSEDSSKGESL